MEKKREQQKKSQRKQHQSVRKHHSSPPLSSTYDYHYQNFLLCGTFEREIERRRCCSCCTVAIQEQGNNFHAQERAVVALESDTFPNGTQVVDIMNYIKATADAGDENLDANQGRFNAVSVEESTDVASGVLVHGRCRYLVYI